jgi:hypothetical protein
MPEVVSTDDSTQSLVDVDSPHVTSVSSDFGSQSIKTETQAMRIEREEEAKRMAEEALEKARLSKEKSKSKASRIANDPQAVYRIANGIIGAVAAAGVAWGAYQKHARGELSWKVVGLWSGVLAAFGAGDYFLGQ